MNKEFKIKELYVINGYCEKTIARDLSIKESIVESVCKCREELNKDDIKKLITIDSEKTRNWIKDCLQSIIDSGHIMQAIEFMDLLFKIDLKPQIKLIPNPKVIDIIS